jgi:hypothetical protein
VFEAQRFSQEMTNKIKRRIGAKKKRKRVRKQVAKSLTTQAAYSVRVWIEHCGNIPVGLNSKPTLD